MATDPDDAAGHFVRTGLRGLVARGHTVTVVHPHPGGGAVLGDDAGITRLAVGAGRRRSALAYRGGMPERLTRSGAALLEAPRLVRGLRRATAERADRHDEAITVLTSGMQFAEADSRENLGLRYHIGMAHEAAGRPDTAGEIDEEIQAVAPNFLDIATRLNQLARV